MKSLVRSLAADTLQLARVTALARKSNRSSLVILCYHRVLPTPERENYIIPALAVTPEAFEKQIAVVVKHYHCVPLHEAVNKWKEPAHDKPLLAITFDDGYADNALHAAPILEKFGVRATFFVVSGLIGTAERAWYDLLGRMVQRMARQPIAELTRKPAEDDPVAVWIAEHFRHRHGLSVTRIVAAAKKLPHALRIDVMVRLRAAAPDDLLQDSSDQMMSPEQLRYLASRGHEIGSHTMTHPLLPQLNDDDLCSELTASKEFIEQVTGAGVTSFAYPNGDHDNRVVDAARAAGYHCAVTMQSGLNPPGADPLRLRRIYVTQERFSRGNGAFRAGLFEMELSGLADLLFLRRHRGTNST
jgi:peptidoglycan/xylan/chitin deacetylase (PgdA/CDA1 family)